MALSPRHFPPARDAMLRHVFREATWRRLNTLGRLEPKLSPEVPTKLSASDLTRRRLLPRVTRQSLAVEGRVAEPWAP
jgi:hypothetical protein